MTQQDVAEAGGPSTAVQRQIEREQATSYRPKTFRTHEKALRLRRDSFRMALAGGSFIPVADRLPEQPKPREPVRQDNQVSLDGLSEDQKQAIENMLRVFHSSQGNDKTA